jgi:hypothetical protein
MNTTIRNLIVALPLATAALAMTPGTATADPVPSGPGDISSPAPGPIGPGDLTNPEPEPTHPTGPGDLTAPQPCPTHGVCGGNDGDDDGKTDGGSGDNGGNNGGHKPQGNQGGDTKVSSIALPTRIDAGLAPAAQDDANLQLSWVLAGGALVTASGAAFAARRVRSRA